MIELKCQNCGSNSLEYKDGFFVCPYCDSRYLADNIQGGKIQDNKTQDNKKSEEELVKRLMDLHWKKHRCKITDPESAKLWLEYSDEIDVCVKEILEINDRNANALTLQMLQTIEDGLKTGDNAEAVISIVEKIIQLATEEDWKNVEGAVRLNFDHYKERFLELNPGLSERVQAIDEFFRNRPER